MIRKLSDLSSKILTTSWLGLGRKPPARLPDLRQIQDFRSRFLPDSRTVIVYLPPGYDANPERRYPVLYLQDGQNLFDSNTAFGGTEWRVDETADRLISQNRIEPLIIVGIYNTGEHRLDEYTPTRDPKLGGGAAPRYGRMLLEELIPLINVRYRTLRGPQNTGLGGSSLGGLVSLYLGMTYAGVFGKLAVLSPSVWWDNRAILQIIASLFRKPDLRIWLDMGTSEGGMSLQDSEKLRDVLAAKGWVLGKDLYYFEAEGATHNEAAWAGRVEPFLRYLFPVR